PPAAKLFERSMCAAIAKLERLIAVLFGLYVLVQGPRRPLGDLLFQKAGLERVLLALQLFGQLLQLLGDEVNHRLLAIDRRLYFERQRLLPTVVAGQIAAVPLGSD